MGVAVGSRGSGGSGFTNKRFGPSRGVGPRGSGPGAVVGMGVVGVPSVPLALPDIQLVLIISGVGLGRGGRVWGPGVRLVVHVMHESVVHACAMIPFISVIDVIMSIVVIVIVIMVVHVM